MNEFAGLLISVLSLVISVGLSILVMINGWGLSPQSWWWIIGGGCFGQMVLLTFSHIGGVIAKK